MVIVATRGPQPVWPTLVVYKYIWPSSRLSPSQKNRQNSKLQGQDEVLPPAGLFGELGQLFCGVESVDPVLLPIYLHY